MSEMGVTLTEDGVAVETSSVGDEQLQCGVETAMVD